MGLFACKEEKLSQEDKQQKGKTSSSLTATTSILPARQLGRNKAAPARRQQSDLPARHHILNKFVKKLIEEDASNQQNMMMTMSCEMPRSTTSCRGRAPAADLKHKLSRSATSFRGRARSAELNHELQSSNMSYKGRAQSAELKHELSRSTTSCRAQTLAVEVEDEVQNLSTSCRAQTLTAEVSHELQRPSTKCRGRARTERCAV
ncbi:hypothetical protein SLEP1_g31390 [Rubroshorea leprosula]|uniref:Uncharacterized protein n=1 Tax=Rubroshorea leprosula TaxID=152421 RepID=A0AAV5KAF5_9ROSI|nr:hypothetical protein SLEP1_g31390 [Rubroshorea leprosula]